MISTPPYTTVTRSVPGRTRIENEKPALSPKRCFAQQEEDLPSQLELKRRHVHHGPQPSRRVPLDPLSASDLENRRIRRSQSADSLLHLSLVTPSPTTDLRVLRPEQPSTFGPRGAQLGDRVCSWPPPTPATIPGGSSHSSRDPVWQQTSQRPPLRSFDENQLSRATFFGPPIPIQTERSMVMANPIRTGDLWRSGCGLTKAQRPVNDADLLLCPTPPGLSPPSDLRRTSSDPDSLHHLPLSLTLALGSQPLKASEPTKVIPPIGAERSRVASITLPKSPLVQNSPVTGSNDSSQFHWRASLLPIALQENWQDDGFLLSTTKAQAATGYVSGPREDLERLSRQALWNKHGPKILSPLNPLRSTASGFDLSGDPTYQLHMPQPLSNCPSSRYSRYPPRRARTVCDSYQSPDWDTTCMHCQECKRDSVGKRLLALRYRQYQALHVQRGKPLLAFPHHGTNPSVVMDNDHLMLASRIREAFAYDLDDEEKSLWEEIAAVTGVAPPAFSRVGTPCAVATHRRAADDGLDDVYEEYAEMPDKSMHANPSPTLFRDLSVCAY